MCSNNNKSLIMYGNNKATHYWAFNVDLDTEIL